MTITLNQQLIDLNIPRIAAILNVTPDSFYDGGQLKNHDRLLNRVQEHIDQGADIIDIGGYSTRPGAAEVSVEEELSRVIPVVELLQDHFPNTPLSIDTFRSEVALQSLEKGAAMINDVTGSQADPKLLDVVASFQVPYIGMHMRGNPQTMNTLTDYEDIVVELRKHFSWLAEETAKRNLNDLIIDPGFGFAKTAEQNFFLLNHLDAFKLLKLPILVGLSRKSMIYKTLQLTPEEALNGTSALHMIALERGAHFLRVHDVKPAKECIDLYLKLKQSNT
ncbi:dihydropteroate synthase [Marivivens sp.]|uniref:dihydropteroate synthase n=1 Tax=Marivivens sp. TaxID=1978374 RepID=UPI0025BD1CD3|nr:dihydropteroate synthase [Marivivens sp.]